MFLGNTIEFTHMSLRLVPKVFDAIEVVLFVCKKFGVVNSIVLEIGHIQHVIATPTVRINDAIRHDLFPNKGIKIDDDASGVILV